MEPADLEGSEGLSPKGPGPVQSVPCTAADPFLSPQQGTDVSSSAESQQPVWPRLPEGPPARPQVRSTLLGGEG